ncbi:MAG: hypothetical protein SNI51_05940 [Rikenellaceae bacterium]
MTQKKQTTAQTERTASASTMALINAKCALSDLYSDILNAIALLYGEEESDKCWNEIYEKQRPLRELIDRFLIESIDCKIGSTNSKEF